MTINTHYLHTHIFMHTYPHTQTHIHMLIIMSISVHTPSDSNSFYKTMGKQNSYVKLSRLVKCRDQRNMNAISCGPGMNIFSGYSSCKVSSWFPVVSLNNTTLVEFTQRSETYKADLWIYPSFCGLGVDFTLYHCLHLGFKGLQGTLNNCQLEYFSKGK